MRKSCTAQFKAKMALEAMKGERSLSELASKYEVHPIRSVSGGWTRPLRSTRSSGRGGCEMIWYSKGTPSGGIT